MGDDVIYVVVEGGVGERGGFGDCDRFGVEIVVEVVGCCGLGEGLWGGEEGEGG